MFGAEKKFLTVSINEGAIKLAQASFGGNVEKVARGAFAGGTDEGAKALKALLGPFNRKASVICVVPANVATAKVMEVPSSDPEEIKSIINLQASRHTPYSREEVLIGYINLGINTINNTRLLLVIVHRDMVKDRITILEKAGLSVDQVMFAPEAEARFYARALNLKKDSPPQGVIDFALHATTFMIIGKGTLLFVRHIPVGIKAMLEGGDAPVKLEEEIKKSMEAFTQEDGNEPPGSYTVTTAHEAVQNILGTLKEGLKLEFKPAPFVSFIKGQPAVRKKVQSEFADDSFLDVIAPATTSAKSEVNLMPEEMVLKKTVESQSQEASKSGVAAVVIMMLIGAMLMSNIYFKDVYLNKNLREAFAPQKRQVAKLEEKMNKIKVVRGYMKDRMASLDMVHELYAITPHSIYLNNVSMDEDGTVTIDGISESMSQVFSYVKSLDDSTMFKDAETKSTSTKKDNGKDVAAFEIEFKLDDAAKEQA